MSRNGYISYALIAAWLISQSIFGSLWGFLLAPDNIQVWVASHLFFAASIGLTVVINHYIRGSA